MHEVNHVLRFASLSIGLQAPATVVAAVADAVEPFFEFSPALDGAGAKEELLAVLRGMPEALAPDRRPTRPGETVAVDTSLYAHLGSSGRRWESGGNITIHIELADTWVTIDRATGFVDVWQPDLARLAIELERTIKSLLTIGAELAGAIQCHSSAATLSGDPKAGTVLLLGDMWQGKTTVLLELLAEFRVDQLSCDTTVIFPSNAAGQHLVHGWPSPFSVSQGTMSDHAELAGRIPPERQHLSYDQLWREGKKSVFRSFDVVSWFGARLQPSAAKIASVVLLRFRMDEPVSVKRIESIDAITQALQIVYLGSRDPIYHNWHRWLVCPNERIDNNIDTIAGELHAHVPVYEVTWGPSVVSLLRRTEPLGAWHRCAAPAEAVELSGERQVSSSC